MSGDYQNFSPQSGKRYQRDGTVVNVANGFVEQGFDHNRISQAISEGGRQFFLGKSVKILGRNGAIGNAWEDIGCLNTDNDYFTDATANALELVSDNNADRPGAVGAEVIRVYYLNTDWEEDYQDVELNGTTPIAVASVSILRPLKIEIVKFTDTTVLVPSGTIDLRSVVGKSVRLRILDDFATESMNGYYYVPDDKYLVITDIEKSLADGTANDNEVIVSLYIQEPVNVAGTVYYIERFYPVGNINEMNAESFHLRQEIIVKEHCRIRIRGRADTASGSGIVCIRGFLFTPSQYPVYTT